MSTHPKVPKVYTPKDLAGGGEIFRRLNPPARLAIFGDPVAKSASPFIQNAALGECGIDSQYVRVHVTAEDFSESLAALPKADFLGCNLTMPHKLAALPLMNSVSKEANLMGAINTVAIRDGKFEGFNTDGPGFAAAIKEEFGMPLSSLRVLILGGAGGAGRAITVQCALENCPSITIANRTLEKGTSLAEEIGKRLGVGVAAITFDQEILTKALEASDLIVNATPLGMKEGDPSPLSDLHLGKNHLVYDTVYNGGTTALITQAQDAGSKSASGLSMLLHQGAKAFEIWFGEPAPLETMREALKKIAG
jgi:shikimate dehydrogenase